MSAKLVDANAPEGITFLAAHMGCPDVAIAVGWVEQQHAGARAQALVQLRRKFLYLNL